MLIIVVALLCACSCLTTVLGLYKYFLLILSLSLPPFFSPSLSSSLPPSLPPSFEVGSCYIVQAGLELTIPLSATQVMGLIHVHYQAQLLHILFTYTLFLLFYPPFLDNLLQ